MFRAFRYLPVNRGEQSSSSPSDDTVPPVSAAHETGIEMTQTRRDNSPTVFRARVVGVLSRNDNFDESFDELEDDSPSPLAVVAVRLCVWALFLFGFLMLFHNQQEKFLQDRSRQAGRLRSTQLLHLDVPWIRSSGFTETDTCFRSQFIDSSPFGFGINRFSVGSETHILKRNGMSGLTSDTIGSHDHIHSVQMIGDTVLKLKRNEKDGYSFVFNGKSINFPLQDDVLFFKYFPDSSTYMVVARPSKGEQVDCLTRFSAETCIDSKPVLRSKAYFFDDSLNVLIAVGIDSISTDKAGNDLKGVYVQSISPSEGAKVDISVSIPFINRFDEGMWTFSNSPLTDGFIVLLPIMGFPPAPVQHVVALRDISDEVMKGSALRMESDELRLFRKIDALQFKPPPLIQGICSC